MRKLLMAAVILVVLAPASALAGGGDHGVGCAGFAGGPDIVMLDSCFQGTAHFAAVDSTIVIRNEGGWAHTFTAVDGSFDSGELRSGESYELVVAEPGIYEVFCALYGTPSGEGMAGILLVGEPSQLAITAPPNLDLISQAVSDGNHAVIEALDGHALMIAGLTSSHSRLAQEIKEQAATTGIVETEPVATEPTSASHGATESWWARISIGVLVGLALAGVASTIRHRRLHSPDRPQVAIEVHPDASR